MAKYDRKNIVKGTEEMVEDSERLHSIKVLMDQEGGRLLVDALQTDILGSINRLSVGYKEMAHTEMIAECASLRANMDLMTTLTGAKQQEEEMDAIIKETIMGN